MQNIYQTKRLTLKTLELNDAAFITELVNKPEWLKFIGDRNIRTEENAREYVQKIKDNPTIIYWVVRLADVGIPIGIITFIKRDYLGHYDIGFAFLSQFTNKGYACEATTEVMKDILNNPSHTHILATTVRENVASIKLLGKLGLRFENKIQYGNDVLLIYAVSADELFINRITASFYSAFTNANQQLPALENIYTVCIPEAIVITKKEETYETFALHNFIKPRAKILSDGTLTEFSEYQIFQETRVIGSMAQRFSKYAKKGYRNGQYFEANGNKLFQYVKTSKGWKIASVIWEDEKG